MKKRIILLACNSLLFLSLHAQKDAPVAGHAATLFDLLRKDYNTMADDLRPEEIAKDRSTVISILKVYIDDTTQDKSTRETFRKTTQRLLDTLASYNILKKTSAAYSTIGTNVTKAAETIGFLEEATRVNTQLEMTRKNYFALKQEADNLELSIIMEQYKQNEFLKKATALFIEKYEILVNNKADKFASSNSSSSIQKSIPFIGGELSFETVIDGLSRFLAKRIKEELTTYVIGRIQTWLNNSGPEDPLAEVKVLLPRTTSYLSTFAADKVTNFVNEIKQYIEDDFNHLLTNAANLRSTPRISRLIAAHPDIDFAFEALEVIPNLSSMKQPLDYFTILETSRNIDRWKDDADPIRQNISNAISMTTLLSRSLVIIDNGESRFAGVDFLNSYASELNYYMFYIGFLRQQNVKYYQIKFKRKHNDGEIELETLLKAITNDNPAAKYTSFFKTLLTTTSKNAEQIFNIATDIRKANKAGKKIGPDSAYAFIEGIITFSEQLTETVESIINTFSTTPSDQRISVKNVTSHFFNAAHAINEMVLDTRKQKYAAALTKGISIGSMVVDHGNLEKFYQLIAKFSSLDGLNNLATLNWQTVGRDFLVRLTTDSHIQSSLRKAMSAVTEELSKIELFYQLNYAATSPLLENIKLLRSKWVAGLTDEKFSSDLITFSKSIFTNQDFRKLVISYTVGASLDAILHEAGKEMLEFSITPKNSTQPVHPFTEHDVAAFTVRANEYLDALFFKMFINPKEKAEKTLAETQLKKKLDMLIALMTDYLAKIPETIDFKINQNVLLIVHFVNDIAVAQNAEDVEKAIDAFALPAGSYAIKRSALINFSLNSYPGILVGCEIANKHSGNKNSISAFSTGFTAPFGINVSWGLKRGHSFGIFLPIIDVGAVTRLRLDNSSDTKTLPEFSFKNILSPGLYLSWGFRKTPFSLNAGLQYGPELREIQPNGSIRNYDSYRVGVGAVLDIPIFNFKTKPR